jgi:hypothetical protein
VDRHRRRHPSETRATLSANFRDGTLAEIKKNAEVLVRPPYTSVHYLCEVYALAYQWDAKGILSKRLREISQGQQGLLRPGQNELVALVRATSEFERQRDSKYAAILAKGLAKKQTPIHFWRSLQGERKEVSDKIIIQRSLSPNRHDSVSNLKDPSRLASEDRIFKKRLPLKKGSRLIAPARSSRGVG